MQFLSKRQQQIYDFIRETIRDSGFPPSVREIGAHFGFRSPNAAICHLKALEKKGLIRRSASTSRGIKLLDSSVALPMVGRISAGLPLMACQQNERIDFRPLFSRGRFCYVVEGRGIPGCQIGPGDFVIVDRAVRPVRKQPVVRKNGRLALFNGEKELVGTVVGVIRAVT